MPRQHRTINPDSIYHVTSRGVERRDIFLEDRDRLVFLKYMTEALLAGNASLLAYCLMDNHFHLMVAQREVSLSNLMHSMLTRYSTYFNHVYRRSGHLFQGRFHSETCEDDAYLIHLPVYIHRNPVRAKMVKTAGEWKWSGHQELLSGQGQRLDLTRFEALTGMPPSELRERYLERMCDADAPADQDVDVRSMLQHLARINAVEVRAIFDGDRCPRAHRVKLELLRWADKRGISDSELSSALHCSEESLRQFRRRSRDSRA